MRSRPVEGFEVRPFLVMKDGDTPKMYDVEFKARAVRLVRDHLDDDGSVTAASVAVGAQLGVARESLRRSARKGEEEAETSLPDATTCRRLVLDNTPCIETGSIESPAVIATWGALSPARRQGVSRRLHQEPTRRAGR